MCYNKQITMKKILCFFKSMINWWRGVPLGDRICTFVVVFVLIASCYYINEQQKIKQKASADSLKREERLNTRKNVVVLGVDQLMEEDNGQRSDTIFVMMFDPEKRQCSLLNIPRDTRVQMEVNGKPDYDKINAAYTYGNVQNTMKVLEEFLGIQIDHYLMIDVSGFKRVVDAIGGVDLYVDRDMQYDDFKQGLHINLKAGQQHLDGEHAMQYVRFRKEYGDIGRIRRQQRFLWAVQQKIVSGQMLMKIPGLTKELISMVKTNLPIADMLPMARTLYDLVRENNFHMSVVPGTSEYLYDISYWTPHILETRKMVADLQGVPFEGRLTEAANNLNEIYEKSVAKGRKWQEEHDALAEAEEENKIKQAQEQKKIESAKITDEVYEKAQKRKRKKIRSK